MFEPSKTDAFEAQTCSHCRQRREGAHYNLFHITAGIESLKCIFPDGKANEMNFALFSTSGVHGSYTTIEQIENSLTKYADYKPKEDEDWPDDYRDTELTIQIVQPRICCLRYGTMEVTLADIPYLKKLRETSWEAMQTIGRGTISG
jgi:hypothetical protein